MIHSGPCEDCGAPVDREEPLDAGSSFATYLARRSPVCDACIDRRHAEEAEEEAQAEAERQAQARRQRERSCELPEGLRAFTLQAVTPEQQEAVAAAREWAAGGLRGLLLVGPVGTGKTYIAAAASWSSLDHRPLRWYSAPILLARLSAGFESPLRDSALDTLAGTTRAALALDDLDKARPTEYGAEQVFGALDARVVAGDPLIATSNRTLDELGARWPEPYGEAIASRLAGWCRVVEVRGDDLRRA